MDKERLKAEQDILERKMPENSYRFMDLDTTKPYLVLLQRRIVETYIL